MSYKLGWVSLLVRGTVLLLLLLFWVWGSLAILFASPGPHWLQTTLACLFAALLGWWQTLQPTNNKDWAADVTRVAHGETQGNRLTMHNVRNFYYSSETDFVTNWETREYNLDEIQGLDLFLSYWASEHIAHAIMSWDFGQDRHLAISIETRTVKTATRNIQQLRDFSNSLNCPTWQQTKRIQAAHEL